MEKEMELKTYTNDKTIVQNAIGISAVMQLLNLLWQDKTIIELNKVAYNVQDKTITIKTRDYTYIFTNAPIAWNGSLDTSLLHKQIYNKIAKEVK